MKTLCRMWGNEGILEVLMSTPGLVVVLIGLWVMLVQSQGSLGRDLDSWEDTACTQF